MTDWRTIERELFDYFRTRKYRPYRKVGDQNASLIGEVLIDHGNKPINLSELARELADNPALTK